MAGRRRRRGAGSVYLRADGRWVAAPPGEKATYHRTEAAAWDALDAAIRRRRTGEQPPSMQPLADFLLTWLEEVIRPNRAPTTYETYRRAVRLHVVPDLGALPLARLTAADVQRLLNRKATTLSPGMVGQIRATLRAALAQAVRWGLVARNVAALVTVPPRRGVRPKTILAPDQARALLAAAARERLGVAVVIGLALGLRRSELRGLRWADVDLAAGVLRVEQQVLRVTGQGWVVRPPKSGRRRVVRLLPVVAAALARQRARQTGERARAGADWADHDLVVCTRWGTPLADDTIGRMLTRACAAAGVPRVTPHDLRRSCASFLVALGVDVRTAMEILGHRTSALLLEVYAGPLGEAQRAAAARVEALLTSGQADRLSDQLSDAPAGVEE